MFQIITTNDWYLKGTTWTSDPDRASKFNSRDEAQAALDRAKKFMRPAAYKAARIEEVGT